MKTRFISTLLCLLLFSALCNIADAVDSEDAATYQAAGASAEEERNRERENSHLVVRAAVAAIKARQNPDDDKGDSEESVDKNGDDRDNNDAPPAVPSYGTVYRQPPLRIGVTRAPRLGTRPAHSPLADENRRTIRDAIVRPIEFGEPDLGFEPPDWTEPLRDIEADSMISDLQAGATQLSGNVRLRLGEMLFNSDEFRYAESVGSYKASGNVLVRQHHSHLTAKSLEYFAPDLETARRTFILEPGPNEWDLARRRLTMGRLLAEQLNVVEPTRHLYAEYADYDFATQTGELRNTHGLAAVFFYNAERVQILGPQDAIIENAWFTTCPDEHPHYRIRVKELTIRDGEAVSAKKARLQIGRHKTPIMMPFWKGGGDQPWMLDFDSGRRAAIGYFTNVGLQFEVSPEVSVGPRLMPTHKEGVGIGGDLYYDFSHKPASRLYRTQGEAHVLYTTKERGYGLWRHRYDLDNDLVLRMEAEQWSDRDFFKDFFYDEYRNRTTPRTFANVTYRQPAYIATGTTRVSTHSWVRETERLPEATFHLVERPLGHNFYVSYDNVTGYNRRDARDLEAMRTVNIARLSYDWAPHPAIGVTPFYEAEGTWYQRLATTDSSAARFSNTLGVTLQTRFHKVYPGILGFSGFKHIVAPSITYSYRPSSSLSPYEAPHFDALDNVYGRSRIETKISNILYGRDAETQEVWQVGRITLYQGNDFWNEVRKANDYEVEIDIRPRPWWGAQLVGERHISARYEMPFAPSRFARLFPRTYERIHGRRYDEEFYVSRRDRADYSRLLTQVYYDNTMQGGNFSGRVGFAYTNTQGRVFNREVLYGLGYKLGENWGVGFEHIYNMEGGELRSQTYEIRRRFHCWESALRFRDRESGFDVNVEISLVAFPGSTIRF